MRLFLFTMALFGCGGCASVTQRAPRDVTPEAIDGGIETELSERSRQAALETIDPPRIALGSLAPGRRGRDAGAVGTGTADGWTVIESGAGHATRAGLSAANEPRPAQILAGFAPALASYEGVMVEAIAKLAKGNETNFYYGGALAIVFGALLIGGALGSDVLERKAREETPRREEVVGAALRMLSSPDIGLHSAQRYATSDGDLTAAEAELVRTTVQRLNAKPAAHPTSASPFPLVRMKSVKIAEARDLWGPTASMRP